MSNGAILPINERESINDLDSKNTDFLKQVK